MAYQSLKVGSSGRSRPESDTCSSSPRNESIKARACEGVISPSLAGSVAAARASAWSLAC